MSAQRSLQAWNLVIGGSSIPGTLYARDGRQLLLQALLLLAMPLLRLPQPLLRLARQPADEHLFLREVVLRLAEGTLQVGTSPFELDQARFDPVRMARAVS